MYIRDEEAKEHELNKAEHLQLEAEKELIMKEDKIAQLAAKETANRVTCNIQSQSFDKEHNEKSF